MILRVISLILLACLVLITTGCGAVMKRDVIATVNGEPITLQEYQDYRDDAALYKEVFKLRGDLPPKDQIIKALIEMKVIDQEVRKRGITVSDKEVDKGIAMLKASFKRAGNKDAFARRGYSIDEYCARKEVRGGIRTGLLRGKLADQFPPKPSDTPTSPIDEILTEFDEYRKFVDSLVSKAEITIIDKPKE